MPKYIEPIEKLIYQFTKLPGVGAKTAQRYALTVLGMSEEDARVLADSILEAKQKVHVCSICGNYTDTDPCQICQTRDKTKICVVQEAKDVLAIERLGVYDGVYHVLGGVLNPLKGRSIGDIRFEELFARLNDNVKELIIATDTSREGDATANFVAYRAKMMGINVTRLAQGMAACSELQYADETTLSLAFRDRKSM